MSNEIIVETGTILESLNNKVDLDGGNYIGSGLETYINKNSKSGFNLFDTKIVDHILESKEALGWALQGTYVTKDAYPDFYNKCLEEFKDENTTSYIPSVDWTQPIATADTTAIGGGDMVITASSVSGSWKAYLALDGIGTASTKGWATNGTNSVGWWQVKFPYKIRITGLKYYRRYSGSTDNATTGRFYTSSEKTVSIGNEFSVPAKASEQYSLDITNISSDGIVTDTIYLETQAISGSYGGMDYLEITAVKDILEAQIHKNPNGHKFYPLKDKPQIDAFYEKYGIADFYGIDEENERVFLPRNKWFAIVNSDVVKTDENKYLHYCVGNTEVNNAITNVTEVTTSENDTIPLFTGMYFDFKPNNVSWLKAGEQQNSGGIYETCYNTLVEIVNGVNNYDLKVINQADMVSGVVYDEYWILDQDSYTFRTPLKISSRSYEPIAPVVGNGMNVGFTNGVNNYGMIVGGYSQAGGALTGTPDAYGQQSGTVYGTDYPITPKMQGISIVNDETKSGIEAHLVENTTAQLYFKVANAVQNLELLDAGEVLEALANKLDRGQKEEIISWNMPDYSSGVSISTGWVATYDCIGYCCASNGDSNTRTVTVDGVEVYHCQTTTYPQTASAWWLVPKGSTVSFAGKFKVSPIVYPFKGAN